MVDKDKIKEELEIEEVYKIVEDFSGEPMDTNFGLTCLTICHNKIEDLSSRKLYYYDNTKLFKCFTECSDTFDIFELIIKCFKIQKNEIIDLPQAITYLLNRLGKNFSSFSYNKKLLSEEDEVLMNLINSSMKEYNDEEQELKEYQTSIIDNLPLPRIIDWEEEGISYDTLKYYNIRFYTPSAQIIIPHYDINNRLVGIRGRLMIKEDADKYGKYMPLIASGVIYSHPLGFNFYGLNFNKKAVEKFKTIIIFEGEKSVLKYGSYFNNEENISVAVCGSSISNNQIKELIKLDINEVVIAFDRQYIEYKDEECIKWHKKINEIVCKIKDYIKVSVIFDTENKLNYKDSPIDQGRRVFIELYKNRKEVK